MLNLFSNYALPITANERQKCSKWEPLQLINLIFRIVKKIHMKRIKYRPQIKTSFSSVVFLAVFSSWRDFHSNADNSAVLMSAKLADLLSCSICLETLIRPKALPCQHTFCYDPCLKNIKLTISFLLVIDNKYVILRISIFLLPEKKKASINEVSAIFKTECWTNKVVFTTDDATFERTLNHN